MEPFLSGLLIIGGCIIGFGILFLCITNIWYRCIETQTGEIGYERI